MRGVLDNVVGAGLRTRCDSRSLLVDLDHGVAELVDVAETLTLGRLDLWRGEGGESVLAPKTREELLLLTSMAVERGHEQVGGWIP